MALYGYYKLPNCQIENKYNLQDDMIIAEKRYFTTKQYENP